MFGKFLETGRNQESAERQLYRMADDVYMVMDAFSEAGEKWHVLWQRTELGLAMWCCLLMSMLMLYALFYITCKWFDMRQVQLYRQQLIIEPYKAAQDTQAVTKVNKATQIAAVAEVVAAAVAEVSEVAAKLQQTVDEDAVTLTNFDATINQIRSHRKHF